MCDSLLGSHGACISPVWVCISVLDYHIACISPRVNMCFCAGLRGVQNVHCVMHRCIVVKVEGNEKHRKYVKTLSFTESGGEFAKVGGKEKCTEIGVNE